MAILAINFPDLLKDIPRGAWVAVSSDQARVIAFGADMRDVLQEARSKGEPDPIILRVPESGSTLIL